MENPFHHFNPSYKCSFHPNPSPESSSCYLKTSRAPAILALYDEHEYPH